MDQKIFVLVVTLATVGANLVFAITGLTGSVSCTVNGLATDLQATALAAFGD